MEERLSKFLANSGLGARRKMEEYIESGRVVVNGERVTKQGVKIDPERDMITVDGQMIVKKQTHQYVLLHKPAGYICTAGRQEKRKKVHDLLPATMENKDHLVIVGRLDKDSEGLLLLTDDGALANSLMHPRYEKEKEYKVIVRGEISDEAIEKLRSGVEIEVDEKPYTTRPTDVTLYKKDKKSLLHIVLREGKKRQIRLMCKKIGYPVTYLSRVRLGPLKLGNLQRGDYRLLTEQEVTLLRT